MSLFSDLSSEEKRKIRNAVVPVLEKYRLLSNMESNMDILYKRLETAINKLPNKEKLLIEGRYTNPGSEYMKDYDVYNLIFEPPISQMTYNKIRDNAMIKLALYLNINTGVDIKI